MVIFHHTNLEVLVVQALVLSEYCLQVCKVLNKKSHGLKIFLRKRLYVFTNTTIPFSLHKPGAIGCPGNWPVGKLNLSVIIKLKNKIG